MLKETSNHAVFSLSYHLIFVTKRRIKVLDEESTRRAGEIIARVGAAHSVTLEEINGEADHIHLLIRTKPSTNIVKFIDSSKSATSRILKAEFPTLREALPTPHLWSRSYCLLTVGSNNKETVRRYIQNQGND